MQHRWIQKDSLVSDPLNQALVGQAPHLSGDDLPNRPDRVRNMLVARRDDEVISLALGEIEEMSGDPRADRQKYVRCEQVVGRGELEREVSGGWPRQLDVARSQAEKPARRESNDLDLRHSFSPDCHSHDEDWRKADHLAMRRIPYGRLAAIAAPEVHPHEPVEDQMNARPRPAGISAQQKLRRIQTLPCGAV